MVKRPDDPGHWVDAHRVAAGSLSGRGVHKKYLITMLCIILNLFIDNGDG